jgi:hypothetical protein
MSGFMIVSSFIYSRPIPGFDVAILLQHRENPNTFQNTTSR